MRFTGDVLIEDGRARWAGPPMARTTYPFLMYAPGAEFETPLGPGSEVVVGPLRLVVCAEEPGTATVLVRRRGPWGWLWWQIVGRFRDDY